LPVSVHCIRSPLVPSTLRSCVTVGADQVPRFWATVHDLTEMMALAPNTRRNALAGIDAFYVHVETIHGADVLDRLLVDLDVETLSSALEAFLVREHNLAAVEQRATSRRWVAASRFVLSTLRNIAAIRGKLHDVDGFRHRLQNLERRVQQMAWTPPSHQQTLRALPSGVLQDLYAIFDPKSERNPFRSEAERLRNYALFHVLLHCGLRAGEALLLPVNCIRSQHDPSLVRDRHWMTVRSMFEDATEIDPRASQPSLKNANALRQIPVTDRVTMLIRDFSAKYRRATRDTDALFVSNCGRPLSKRMLESLMARADAALSRTARDLLIDQRGPKAAKFTAHDLRHTCAVTRLNALRKQGVAENKALSKLRVFFGWSSGSQMPRYYARAYWENELDRIWNDVFDEHIYALRELESAW
jgi:integrase